MTCRADFAIMHQAKIINMSEVFFKKNQDRKRRRAQKKKDISIIAKPHHRNTSLPMEKKSGEDDAGKKEWHLRNMDNRRAVGVCVLPRDKAV